MEESFRLSLSSSPHYLSVICFTLEFDSCLAFVQVVPIGVFFSRSLGCKRCNCNPTCNQVPTRQKRISVRGTAMLKISYEHLKTRWIQSKEKGTFGPPSKQILEEIRRKNLLTYLRIYLLLGCRTSESISILNYRRPFFSLHCLLSPSFKLYLTWIPFNSFQPPRSRSSHSSSSSFRFTLKYSVNYPSVIHSY